MTVSRFSTSLSGSKLNSGNASDSESAIEPFQNADMSDESFSKSIKGLSMNRNPGAIYNYSMGRVKERSKSWLDWAGMGGDSLMLSDAVPLDFAKETRRAEMIINRCGINYAAMNRYAMHNQPIDSPTTIPNPSLGKVRDRDDGTKSSQKWHIISFNNAPVLSALLAPDDAQIQNASDSSSCLATNYNADNIQYENGLDGYSDNGSALIDIFSEMSTDDANDRIRLPNDFGLNSPLLNAMTFEQALKSVNTTAASSKKREPATTSDDDNNANNSEKEASTSINNGAKRTVSVVTKSKPRKKTVPPSDYICKLCSRGGHWMEDCEHYRPHTIVLNPEARRDASKDDATSVPPPPPNYLCRLCSVPGHWIDQCSKFTPKIGNSAPVALLPRTRDNCQTLHNQHHFTRTSPRSKNR